MRTLTKKNTGHSWEEQGFNEKSALNVKGGEEDGYDFFVNIDNVHLLSEIKPLKNTDVQVVQAKYKFGLVLVGLALLNESNSKETKPDDEYESDSMFSTIQKVSKAVSPVIIPMIDTLGTLETQDLVSAIPEEVE